MTRERDGRLDGHSPRRSLRQVQLGAFIAPDAQRPDRTLEQIAVADETGLDLVGVQDHPYQRRFLDTWTLLSFVAARTRHVRLVPDVANLPLRQPAVLAKAAASLDVLSGGRVELGLGAGAFWDAIEAMGGPRRNGPESVDALEEAIAIIRAAWDGERAVRVDGRHYRAHGFHPGPPPAHRIGIWLGAYGPRMMGVVGRLADGWLPSIPRLPLDEIARRHELIDRAAERAGRNPGAILRACNLSLQGEPPTWPSQCLRLIDDHRFETLILSADDGGDPVGLVRRFGEDLAPAVRERIG
jgi:alkanesulfonate monooxygenase SsuD/methylene tetrahydromethanopterin reductase-like flavin-dependent oxidoreductase (luciferase family)